MSTADWPKAGDQHERAAAWARFAPTGPAWLRATATDAVADGLALSPHLWRLLMAARAAVALALLALAVVLWRHGDATPWVPMLAAVWLLLGALTLALPRPGTPTSAAAPHWLLTVWADIAVLAALQWMAPSSVNVAPLLVWPVLVAATAGPRVLALGSAAAGTLVLLAAAWRLTNGVAQTPIWTQAALAGSGLFLVALLANHLVARVLGERSRAQRHQRMSQLYADINRRIATDLTEGIIVTDALAHPWWINPAAARMLGVHIAAEGDASQRALLYSPGWAALSRWVRDALPASDVPSEETPRTHDLTWTLPDGTQKRVRLRLYRVLAQGQTAAHVIFLQDLQALEQRLHTERLAAMGRVSAAIAHEIRNPLAAISQASALLLEDNALPAAQRQLLTIIEQNARRIERTVADVLEAARAPMSGDAAPVVALDATVDTILTDWLSHQPQGSRLLRDAGARGARVAFNPEHLRRVLINLLDNAHRYASPAPASIRVQTQCSDNHAQLIVWNDGPAIPPEVRARLYEPFFSSRGRSVGLGLYLSRELCRRYDAELTDEPSERDGRPGYAFIVRMPLCST